MKGKLEMGANIRSKSLSAPKKARRSSAGGAVKSIEAYHHGNLRESLIAAAVKFLEKNPLEKLSLRTLALKAGVSQAAPYRHFKDRNEILAAISQQGFELKFKYMLEAFLANQGNPKELFNACAYAFFKMGLLHPQHFKLMLTSSVCPSPEYPELERAAGLSFALLKKMVEICQSAGVIGPGDPFHKSMHCWAVVTGFTTLYVEGRLTWLGINRANASAALRVFVEQFLHGQQSALEPPSDFKLFSTQETQESLVKTNKAVATVEQILMAQKSADKLPH